MTWDDTICRTSKPYHFWDTAGGCGDSRRYHLQSFDGKFEFRAESTSHGRSTETRRWIRFQYTGQLFGLFGDFLWFNSIRHYWSLVPSKWVHHPAWWWNVLLTRPKMGRLWVIHPLYPSLFQFSNPRFQNSKNTTDHPRGTSTWSKHLSSQKPTTWTTTRCCNQCLWKRLPMDMGPTSYAEDGTLGGLPSRLKPLLL